MPTLLLLNRLDPSSIATKIMSIHVHVTNGDACEKTWLEPSIVYIAGFSNSVIKIIMK